MVGAMSIFILFSNAISAIPGFVSPTGHPSVPLACAILVFLFYNLAGLTTHGPIGYAKQFAGPVPALSWLIFPVEIISHSARLLSLTVRLWANIFASELIYLIFLGLTMAPRQALMDRASRHRKRAEYFSGGDSHRVHPVAPFRGGGAGVRLYDFAGALYRHGNVARTLNLLSLQFIRCA